MELAGSAQPALYFEGPGSSKGARRRLPNVYLGRCIMLAPGALRTARLFGCPERMERALAEGPLPPHLGRFCFNLICSGTGILTCVDA
jgi:hypothetical protein